MSPTNLLGQPAHRRLISQPQIATPSAVRPSTYSRLLPDRDKTPSLKLPTQPTPKPWQQSSSSPSTSPIWTPPASNLSPLRYRSTPQHTPNPDPHHSPKPTQPNPSPSRQTSTPTSPPSSPPPPLTPPSGTTSPTVPSRPPRTTSPGMTPTSATNHPSSCLPSSSSPAPRMTPAPSTSQRQPARSAVRGSSAWSRTPKTRPWTWD
jgi:hypothetical protein